MCSATGYCGFAAVGFPIRISPDQRLYTAPRGFSQCPTSFIGIWRQGIHRKPLVAYLRDAENSKFFAFFSSSASYFLSYSVGKVLPRLTPSGFAQLWLHLLPRTPQLYISDNNQPGKPPGCHSSQVLATLPSRALSLSLRLSLFDRSKCSSRLRSISTVL